MIVTSVRAGGINLSLASDELQQLALLMDETAHIIRESPDWKDHPNGIVEQLEMLASLFTLATVATESQIRSEADKVVTYKRETGTPVFHIPE